MSGETLSDMMTANVVVIQPGSLYVRLGAGCDSSPVNHPGSNLIYKLSQK